MRAIVQRVTAASVSVDDQVIGQIGPGLVLLVGVRDSDSAAAAAYLAEKIAHLRIFADEDSKFHRSVLAVGGAVLLISQFTVYGDSRKGRRPNFSAAAPPEVAAPLLEMLAGELRSRGLEVQTGQFAAHMQVTLTNDGPVTVIVDTPERLSQSTPPAASRQRPERPS